MRKLILMIPILIGMGNVQYTEVEPIEPLEIERIEVEVVEPKFVVPEYTLDVEPLIQAMIMVESEGNDSANSKKENIFLILIYRVFHVKRHIKKRCVFPSKNAKKYLK